MDNLEIYNKVRAVPQNAQKEIKGGRLKGMTDINPMWRFKALTETFGPAGFGWKYLIRDKRMEPGANGEISAFVDVDLYVKTADGWSDAIPGTGGASFVAREKSGLYTSDECFKMALTDAISVACKALGFGADIYWAADRQTKYDRSTGYTTDQKKICAICGKPILGLKQKGEIIKTAKQICEYSIEEYGEELCWDCMKKKKNDRQVG